MKLAIGGKGGVGKTTICAHIVKELSERGRQVLAVDADPSPHLGRLLGFSGLDKITPIAEMKDLLQERSEKNGPFYKINPKVDDLPERFMLHEHSIKLMVLGSIQQAGVGCACADNAVLRSLLNLLLLSPNEDIVLDMEAGVEYLGRGTIVGVDYFLVVVQPYRGSIETALKILRLSKELKLSNVFFIANQITNKEDINFITKALGTTPIASYPDVREIKVFERNSKPIWQASQEFKDITRSLVDKLLTGDISG